MKIGKGCGEQANTNHTGEKIHKDSKSNITHDNRNLQSKAGNNMSKRLQQLHNVGFFIPSYNETWINENPPHMTSHSAFSDLSSPLPWCSSILCFSPALQLSMLSEVRSLVAPQDLELYDRLVLHREREAHQAWHGGLGVLHPPGLCNHTAPGIHDAGLAIPVMVNPISSIAAVLLK